MLDRLELPDRPAELFADLGICRRGVGRPPRDANGFSGQQGGHQRVSGRHREVAQQGVVADVDRVGPNMRDGPQRIQALDRFDLELIVAQYNPLVTAFDGHR